LYLIEMAPKVNKEGNNNKKRKAEPVPEAVIEQFDAVAASKIVRKKVGKATNSVTNDQANVVAEVPIIPKPSTTTHTATEAKKAQKVVSSLENHDSDNYDMVYENQHGSLSALIAYKMCNGDLKVPYKFVVPAYDPNYPEDSWGMKLGCVVDNILTKNAFADHKPELLALGFDYDKFRRTYSTFSWENVYVALQIFKQTHGHLAIQQNYVIHNPDYQYPQECWGMKLGITVKAIRNRTSYVAHEQELLALGFDYGRQKAQTVFKFEQIFEALQHFHAINGHFKVPRKFIVPMGGEDGAYPESTWGMKLGERAFRIYNCEAYLERKNELDAVGFEFNPEKMQP